MPKNELKVALVKTPTGIEGFDEISHGGLPRGRTVLVTGGPGAGKTIFALQTLVNGARLRGEPGIFVAFEESPSQIVANASTFGWDLPALEKKKLFFLDAQLSPTVVRAGNFDLSGLLAALGAKAKAMQAKQIVFDGIDVLLTLLNDPVAEQREVYRVHEWLKQSGLTGLLTAKADDTQQLVAPRYGFMQYMVDCLVTLEHRYRDNVSVRSLRVAKYRGSDFLANEFPYVIGPEGIDVPRVGEADLDHPVFNERISTGISRLDDMLRGGYYRGTSILISGAPGTAKSTLSGAFAEAACRRGERVLYVSFDEEGPEITRNLKSVGIHLAPHIKSGLLKIVASRSELKSADEHLMAQQNIIRDFKPRCLIIDPISALIMAGGPTTALDVTQHLLRLANASGITVIGTSLLGGDNPETEGSALQVSTVADTWIHLSYVVRGGERNRALTIIKSRGTGHSNQVRELILSDTGVALADVYMAGGEVLMGTARWQKEQAEQVEQVRRDEQLQIRQHELSTVTEELNGRIDLLKRELEGNQAELRGLHKEKHTRELSHTEGRAELRRRRGGQAEPGSKPPRRRTKVAKGAKV
jgi:circadian clock protein KaiC